MMARHTPGNKFKPGFDMAIGPCKSSPYMIACN